MKLEPLNWNNLTLIKRLFLIRHNSKLETYLIEGNRFAVGAFVKCKDNGLIRYITKKNKCSEIFKDDGKISMADPSPFCYYDNYEMI